MLRNRLGFIVGLFLVVGIGISIALPPILASEEKTTAENSSVYQDPDTGVIVELNREEEVFPQSWRSAPVNGKAEALDEFQKIEELKKR